MKIMRKRGLNFQIQGAIENVEDIITAVNESKDDVKDSITLGDLQFCVIHRMV